MDRFFHYTTALADAFLADTNSEKAALIGRGSRCLGYTPDWLEKLCNEVLQRQLLGNPKKLINHISHFKPLLDSWLQKDFKKNINYYFLQSPRSELPASFITRELPIIDTQVDLCRLLSLDSEQLEWFCTPWAKVPNPTNSPLHHYYYRWIKKKSNTFRLLEIPKTRLKGYQRIIYEEILQNIPTHPAAHGFIKGRSTYTFTENHLNKKWVLRIDLSDFFTSISYARIFNIFKATGYSEKVVRYLSILCTHRTPQEITKQKNLTWQQRKTLGISHLPQGAPTSPALSNLAAFGLDTRLSGLASKLNIQYSRYADDICISGNDQIRLNYLIPYIASIILAEGFTPNFRKTRVMGSAQRQIATGIILNKHHNLPRKEYETLKATINNCLKKGVSSQSRGNPEFQAHLKGKISYLLKLNPNKGSKLISLYNKINWES